MENRFEQLLRNQLSEEESKQLLKEIAQNPALKKEFESYQNAWDLAKTLERRELKNKVRTIAAHQTRRKNKTWFWYAAASVLILAAGYWAFQPEIQTEHIAQSYFKPYPDKFSSMSIEQAKDSLLQAMTAYNKKDYAEAVRLFNQLPPAYAQEVKLYEGIGLYEMGDKKNAKQIFKKLSQDSTSTYREAARWYLALTHLALNEKEAALLQLNEMLTDSLTTFHREDVSAIIEQLQ